MNSTGMNTAASDSVIDRIVKPISVEPSSAACERRLAHLHVAHDVLEHHDRVVDDEADREHQRHHRQVVEAEAEQLHDRERADDRERQRQARDDRRRDVAQEEEDHQDHEDERHEHRELHVADRLADRLASGRRGCASSTDGGSCAWSVGSSALTASVTATVLVPGWRWMARTIERWRFSAVAVPRGDLVVLDAVDDAGRAPRGAPASRCGR